MTKDPDSTLDYGFNWSGWLEDDETIIESTWEITGTDDALTVGTDTYASTNSGTSTKVWLAGGTLNGQYRITNHIVTNNDPARVEDRSFTLRIKDR